MFRFVLLNLIVKLSLSLDSWTYFCPDADFDCREQNAGKLKCRDESSCSNYNNCNEHAAALRAGYICNSFPWYNGGYPMTTISISSRRRTYSCKNGSSSSSYCGSWNITTESNYIGNGNCTKASSNGLFCSAWTSSQREQYSDCYCLEESSNSGLYCQKWHCEEYKYKDQTWNEGRKIGNYECLTSGVNNSFCASWQGNLNSLGVFKVLGCSCNVVSDDKSNPYCTDWQCDSKRAMYYWPNLYYIVVGWMLFVCIPAIFLLLLFMIFTFLNGASAPIAPDDNSSNSKSNVAQSHMPVQLCNHILLPILISAPVIFTSITQIAIYGGLYVLIAFNLPFSAIVILLQVLSQRERSRRSAKIKQLRQDIDRLALRIENVTIAEDVESV